MLTWKTLSKILCGVNLSIDYPMVKSLLRNKVLYLAGLINEELRHTEEWRELSRRRKLQLDALKEFAEVAESLGVRYVVIKTFKLFPYVPDDVDILILDHDRINDLVVELIKRRYKVRSKGTPEITLGKTASKTYVDLDIHHKIAAGEYIYYPTQLLWNNRRKITIDNVELYTDSWEDECIITMAHAVMKEFEILASDLLHTLLCKNRGLIKLEHLVKTGHIMTYKIFLKLQRLIISNNIGLPYKVPLWNVATLYTYHINHRMRYEGLKPVYELIRFPKAKGINKLLFRE